MAIFNSFLYVYQAGYMKMDQNLIGMDIHKS